MHDLPRMQDYGTFKDSLRAPVHRWFTYPAGFSFKLVQAKIAEYGLNCDSVVADPFSGSGTTVLASRDVGVASVGVDAHSFVSWAARTKCTYYNPEILAETKNDLNANMKDSTLDIVGKFPDLIYKCFDAENLKVLLGIREAIDALKQSKEKEFMRLCLVASLRKACTAGAGWPYIAPSKYAEKVSPIDALAEFERQYELMLSDVQATTSTDAKTKIIIGDSRQFSKHVRGADLVVTSPPYLNNYDYADRTRMETYFMGLYKNWGDITRNIRSKLMVAATTQVSKATIDHDMPTVKSLSQKTHRALKTAISNLENKKKSKPGKKNYDWMTAGYFEDMAKILIEVKRSMNRGGGMILVLGDSAPYGVHIPTDIIIGDLAVGAGFDRYKIEVLRKRGDKWKKNPQRHHVQLRESMVVVS